MKDRKYEGLLFGFLMIIIVFMLSGCADDSSSGVVPESSDRFDETRSHVEQWLTGVSSDKPYLTSSSLKETIVDDWDNQQSNYQIVSVRSEDDYLNSGHIANAIQIWWRDILQDENLSQLSQTKNIIIYCYTGHTGMLVTTVLNLIGYDVDNLKFGMMDWNLTAFNKTQWDGEADYDVETVFNMADEEYDFPFLDSDYESPEDVIKEMAAAYLPSAVYTMKTSDVKAIVDDWENQQTDYQILSVRSESDYIEGHVPYSINIPWADVADEDNLKKLDPSRTIIVYCYTGHTGQIISTVLSILGYDAVNMKFGMMDWNLDAFNKTQWDGEADYPVEVGS